MAESADRPQIVLSTYSKGATQGRALGTAGYSYEFVANAFHALLEQWCDVSRVVNRSGDVERAVARCGARQFKPIHLAVTPFQHCVLSESAINVAMPAWEFPDVPDHAFDGEPRNNWVAMANRCDAVVVGNAFTMRVFERAGIRVPILVVPVPVARGYFELPGWLEARRSVATLSSAAYVLAHSTDNARKPTDGDADAEPPPRLRERLRMAYDCYEQQFRARLPAWMDGAVTGAAHAANLLLRTDRVALATMPRVDLSGVVFTSVFNPRDGRKNWEDLLTAFLIGLKDCDDATLVFKLVTADRVVRDRVLRHYQLVDLPHRCRLVVLPEFLSHEQMLELATASAYYVHATRAEGNCLPLMDYLAAGRPGIGPIHTAMTDYFDGWVGFPVESHEEPTAWPQDSRLRRRTTWNRIVWPSLVSALQSAYAVAKSRPERYAELAARCQSRLHEFASHEWVEQALRQAIATILDRRGATLRLGRVA